MHQHTIPDLYVFHRTSCHAYLNGQQQQDDAQKLTRLLRLSEQAMQIGYVLFVNCELEKVPDGELASDCVLPEGPPNNYEVMASLFNSQPRDADHTAEMWTTVDPNKTNVRAKAVYKLLPGFSLYLTLMGKNLIFDCKIKQGYRELMIACNVQVSSTLYCVK